MIEEIREVLSEMGARLGFASDEFAWAYISCILAVLFCVFYSLGAWVGAMGRAVIHATRMKKKRRQGRRVSRSRKRR